MTREEWLLADAELLEAEITLRETDLSLSEALEASLTDWDEYLHTLTPEAHRTALNGLYEYLREMGAEV